MEGKPGVYRLFHAGCLCQSFKEVKRRLREKHPIIEITLTTLDMGRRGKRKIQKPSTASHQERKDYML